ncbi:putative lipoprotein [Bacteriovorax sp. BSW11_IV]|uniref:hypothetical protein n=1 Tax=Bacteriovorax sp. BSW11_IV TaxID=1353529 RepID=UPI00038A16A2|nr:hypothetical protein [Bacteriovorax sp. BSW11_IV]EQC49373.1 putative lipoprotein [Bacteriovorax sp. BSW11_IV]
MKKVIFCTILAGIFVSCSSSNFRMPLSVLEKHDEKQANLTERQFRQIEYFNREHKEKK